MNEFAIRLPVRDRWLKHWKAGEKINQSVDLDLEPATYIMWGIEGVSLISATTLNTIVFKLPKQAVLEQS